jgi:phosphoribosylformimino-5-aminoimidazole carboxamide ribotide isomerase
MGRSTTQDTARRRAAGFALIPAVDVLGTEAVRLEQGDFARVVVRAGSPEELVRRFAAGAPPYLHVVDLAASRDGGVRPAVIRRLVAAAGEVPVQAAGGVRSPADAAALVAAGAARVVVGTAAFESAAPLGAYVEELGDRLLVALDVRDGVVASSGWSRTTGLTVDEAIDRCLVAGVPRLLCTAIERDGTLAGPDLALLGRVCTRFGAAVLAAGGVRSESDLQALAALGLEGAVVGRALLTGAVALRRSVRQF